jgi:hypothetical protein
MSSLPSINSYFRIRSSVKTRRVSLRVFPIFYVLLLSSCGGTRGPSEEERLRNEQCTPIQSAKQFEETPFVGDRSIVLSFQNIRANINASCMGCHQSPAKTGGFTYIDSWQGQEVILNGVRQWLPGFQESAEKMLASLNHPDESKRMPPADRRNTNPAAYQELARQLEIWIKAGKPEGSFKLGEAPPQPTRGKPRPQIPHKTSELGDCVPKAKAFGFDMKLDRYFEKTKTLPKYLHETDMYTLDPLELARTGTVAYNVEYPLWADNAEKGRWIHVPWKLVDGIRVKQAIEYNPVTKKFNIPDNTRFYKTFYRAVTLPNKKIKMRRMETRIIMPRTPVEETLFGTYQWDESEQIATLVEAPYRDGTPWKDLVLDVVVDENKIIDGKFKMRPYAIPGRQRCVDCHSGSPTKNFVLGFDPLQINKRPWGAAGRIEPVEAHDLDQVSRFLDYGILKGIKGPSDLPVLEQTGESNPQNLHELRANGYMVGNCYHCHNPGGLAMSKENGVQLKLGPGDIFNFNNQQKSIQITSRRMVHQNGDLDSSHIWRKVTDTPAQLGLFNQMPMHTPGAPDCKVQTVVGKWIRSFESLEAAESWEPSCKAENPFHWIDLDFTWVKSDKYIPRRDDWKSVTDGMPQKFRDLVFDSELEKKLRSEYAIGYWAKKPECNFPEVNLTPDKRRPWMMRGSEPKRPFGEVYYTTPGSYFFRNTCVKCHGPKADGESSLARGILNWSGGKVRVANLIDGMFGQKGANTSTFELNGKNYAGNYLIWMAMEGTRVKFPPEIASFMGKHGGQMLNGLREKCLAQISPEKASSSVFMDHEVFSDVCFINNLDRNHPDLVFDPDTNKAIHPEKVEEWLDRAAYNAGWAIFDFLKEASQDRWRPGNDQCEVVFK